MQFRLPFVFPFAQLRACRARPHRSSETVAAARRCYSTDYNGVIVMLRWALIFLVISLVAALFGFTGIAVAAAGIAKFLFFLFLVITLVFLVLALSAARALR
jgi:uncharacterized membrane protein YtjA (UPF0391 family)